MQFKVDDVRIRVEYDEEREPHMRWKAQFSHFNFHVTTEYGDTMAYAIGRCFQSAAEMQNENIGCRLYSIRHVVLGDVPDEYDIKKITDAKMEILAEKISDGLDANGGFLIALESALPECFDKKEDALNEGE